MPRYMHEWYKHTDRQSYMSVYKYTSITCTHIISEFQDFCIFVISKFLQIRKYGNLEIHKTEIMCVCSQACRFVHMYVYMYVCTY